MTPVDDSTLSTPTTGLFVGDSSEPQSTTSTTSQSTRSSVDDDTNSSDDFVLTLRDERLPCAQHLDPDGTTFPTSEWISINGTLPICSLEEVISSVSTILMEEEYKGIIDLEAEWNPVQDPQVPTLRFDDPRPLIEAAHVVLSPFGRPNGWNIKFANRSLANSILDRAKDEHLRVAWKVVQMKEYHYSKEKEEAEDYALANGLHLDDSHVRIENCHSDLDSEYIRYMLSRYDLAFSGTTIVEWKAKTNDGKVAPLMFVIRFADAAWARAAVRELQGTRLNAKNVRFVQYPNQLRYEPDNKE